MTDGGIRAPDRSRLLPELQRMLEQLDAGEPADLSMLVPAEERAASETFVRDLWGALEPVAEIEDLHFFSEGHSIRARLYRPAGASGTVLFIHGGGWVFGSLDSHDGSARVLANRAQANVLSIEYRKGPEHPFPAAVTDVDAGLEWLLAEGLRLGLDTSRIVVCGESAGGNLAAVLARHARDRGIGLAGQVLIYPATDFSRTTASQEAFAEGYFLTTDSMNWFIGQYMQAADRSHPDASPLLAPDLSGLAPAYLATAEFDPLRDEGRAYAARLIEAGNDVTYREMCGAVHGLWVMNAKTPAAEAMICDAAAWMRQALR